MTETVIKDVPPNWTTADAGDEGYRKSLQTRHINMIAIGGAIGTGLFLGAGGRLAQAGPSLAIAYAVCGLFAFFVVRALGELILYRPSSGAFVSYAREFIGEKGAYVAGWMYFLNWSTTGIADITAIALYAHYWSAFKAVPQWLLALLALAIVLTLNLVSVRLFGEMEFWFALIKVATLVVFMGIGIFLLVTQHPVGGAAPGPQLISDHGGLFPLGVLPMILLMSGRGLRLRLGRARGRRGGGDGEPARGHAAGDQLDHVADRDLLRRLGRPSGDAHALERLQRPAEPVRHRPVEHRRAGGGRRDEPGSAHGRHVQPELGAVLDRPHPAVDVDGPLGAEVRRGDEPDQRPLRRRPAHRRGLRARRRAQLRDAGRGVRDRPELRRRSASSQPGASSW